MPTFPTITVELAQAANPLDALSGIAWTDITTYVTAIQITRGRQHELNQTEAGTATLTIEDRDRRFEPGFAAGAYYPNIKPMRRIRIRATWAAVTYDLFHGYVERWVPGYANEGWDPYVEVQAVDMLASFGLRKMASYSGLTTGYGPWAYYRLGEESGGGITFDDSTGNNADATRTGSILKVSPGLIVNVDDDGAQSTTGAGAWHINLPTTAGISSGSFTIMFVVGAIRSLFANTIYGQFKTGPTLTMQIGVDGTTGAIQYRDWLPAGTANVNVSGTTDLHDTAAAGGPATHIAIVRDAVAKTVTLYVNGVQENSASYVTEATFTNAAVQFLPDSQQATGDELAIYKKKLTAAEVRAAAIAAGFYPTASLDTGAFTALLLDEVGWPAADRSIGTGASTVSQQSLYSQPPKTWLDLAAATEDGAYYASGAGLLVFKSRTTLDAAASAATWGDNTGENAYRDLVFSYDVDQLANDVRVARLDGSTSVKVDTTSQTTYGVHSLTRSTIDATDAQAATLAARLLAKYKDPALRIERMVVSGVEDDGSGAGQWDQVLARELMDKVTVVKRPPAGGASISQPSFIIGVGHRIEFASDTWDVTWNLQPQA